MNKSSFQLKRKLYENCPEFVKGLVGMIPFGLISGPVYRATLKQRAAIDQAKPAEIEAIENQRLSFILKYATDQVPFYKSLRSVVDRLPPKEALRAFPTIDKDVVQENFDSFLSREIDRIPYYETTTGGTTGNQLRILLDNDSHYRETGFIHRLWSRVGYRSQSRKATFRGQVFDVEPELFWRPNPIYRELQFSTFHINQASIGKYVGKLREYQPEYLHGYPSVISSIASYLLDHPDEALNIAPKAILLGSEATTDQQRKTIESGFDCRAFSWFGHSERLVLGGECEKNSTYHQLPDYGFLEILDGDEPVSIGEVGEITGTTLWNRVMPLIRYRTDDHARQLESRCECGRFHNRFDSVQGRWNQEFLLGKSGTKVFSTALNMHGPFFNRVIRYQYVQDEIGKVVIRIMPGPEFSDEDKRQIRTEHENRIGHDFDLVIEIIPNIELTSRGKLRRVIQNIPVESK